jgi:hypothetical protein
MREWDGIRADTSDDGEGALFVNNASFFIQGELRRRHGMEGFTDQSGVAIADFWNVGTGRWAIFATSTGDVIALANP